MNNLINYDLQNLTLERLQDLEDYIWLVGASVWGEWDALNQNTGVWLPLESLLLLKKLEGQLEVLENQLLEVQETIIERVFGEEMEENL